MEFERWNARRDASFVSTLRAIHWTMTLVVIVVTCFARPANLQQDVCSNDVDVLFVLDASGSIDQPDFIAILNFVVQVVGNFDVDSGAVRVGAVTFADDVQPAFNLSQFTTRQAVQAAISGIRYTGGTTNTASAIQYARTVMFTAGAGDRANVRNVVLLITDGGSNNRMQTTREAFLAKTSATGSIHFVVIGVGLLVNEAELVTIANYPYNVNLLRASNVTLLPDLLADVTSLLCNDVDECASSPCGSSATCLDSVQLYVCQQCALNNTGSNCERDPSKPTDLVIAITSSSRVGIGNFLTLLEIGRELIYSLSLNTGGSRVAALTFADDSYVQFDLTMFSSRLDILNAISLPYLGGSTNLAAAIRVIRTQLLAVGVRSPSAQPVAVIMVDGRSMNETAAVEEAIAARDAGISLIVVGVSSLGVQLTEWLGVASYPIAFNVFNVASYHLLPSIVIRLITSVINEQDECDSSPCQNSGTCIDLINGYQCQCTDSFTGINCERVGSGRIDLAIVLDTSGSTRNDRFFAIQGFVASFIQNLEISPSKTRVAGIYFNNITQELFSLSRYNSRQDLMYFIQKATFSGGLTNISGALSTLASTVYTSSKGDRLDAPNVAFIITDANANVAVETAASTAAAVRQQYTYVIVLSVGLDPNVYGLWSLANLPSNRTVFTVRSYRDLSGLLNNPLLLSSFSAVSVCASQPCQNGGTCRPYLQQFVCECTVDWSGTLCQSRCARSWDLAFVLDMSSADFDKIYRISLPFIRQVVYGLPVRQDRVRLSFVTAVETPIVQFSCHSFDITFTQLTGHSFFNMNFFVEITAQRSF